ncbi:HAD family hydrolase [Oxynema sp. CENA135]|uniref:HAD family hydrolase n=1 Tax=Oxynema sp. CENA135 TaxID=984206 RepID=UPI00190A9001|nr:HAD family hydrolase [Oxynema sp. CENA135]MBK4730005.1 HAD family hydrolase [Oxynema sp. CENA135]
MVAPIPTLLALDFDGVLCDGSIEYFQSAWRTYAQIWEGETAIAPSGLAERFYPLRPVIETGWEMPVLIRALLKGVPDEQILRDWGTISQKIVAEEDLDPGAIAARLDRIRDEWIASDLDGWLSLHRFYPGTIARIKPLVDPVETGDTASASLGERIKLVIITTKEERFVRSLLGQQGIELDGDAVYGKGVKRPKPDILKTLLAQESQPPQIWFVEDRFKTLEAVRKYPELDAIALYLADWGYNTTGERSAARVHPSIELLSLDRFGRGFEEWRVGSRESGIGNRE